jgi:hypothetical protein
MNIEALTSSDFEQRQVEPQIWCVDIETAANVGAYWRNPWQTSIVRHIADTYMLSWSAKRLGGKQITRSLPDYKGYKPGKRDDKALVAELHELLDGCDVAIAHHGKKFDFPYIRGRSVVNGLPPLKRFQMYDTREMAKRHFGFTSNKLDDIARLLGLGTKIPIHYETWEGCEQGDAKAWSLMTKYNAHDTKLLEAVYLKLRAWDQTHPNANLLLNRSVEGCPTCGGTHIVKKGFSYTTTGRRQEYKCMAQACGRRFTGKHQKITDYR